MSDQDPKTLVDKFLDWCRNQPLIAGIIILSLIIISIATLKESICKLSPKLCESQNPPPQAEGCPADENFPVKIFFRDAQIQKRDNLKVQISNYDGGANTDFAELENPGEENTARITYPSCIKIDDPRLQTLIKLLEKEGYKEEDQTLVVVPFSSKTSNKYIGVSLF